MLYWRLYAPGLQMQPGATVCKKGEKSDEESNFACAGVVTIDFRTFELIEEQIEFFEPKIPYIPSFLHYRESPGYHKVWEKLEEKPDLLMFDGNGIIHPYGFGLASQMGLELERPSIGVAKKLLLGEYNEPLVKGGFSFITQDNENIGAAFQTAKKPAKPKVASLSKKE